MAGRRKKSDIPTTPWGAVDWSSAPVARDGYMGPCEHCQRPAIMKSPASGKPCHKVCDDKAYDASSPR